MHNTSLQWVGLSAVGVASLQYLITVVGGAVVVITVCGYLTAVGVASLRLASLQYLIVVGVASTIQVWLHYNISLQWVWLHLINPLYINYWFQISKGL